AERPARRGHHRPAGTAAVLAGTRPALGSGGRSDRADRSGRRPERLADRAVLRHGPAGRDRPRAGGPAPPALTGRAHRGHEPLRAAGSLGADAETAGRGTGPTDRRTRRPDDGRHLRPPRGDELRLPGGGRLAAGGRLPPRGAGSLLGKAVAVPCLRSAICTSATERSRRCAGSAHPRPPAGSPWSWAPTARGRPRRCGRPWGSF